jgi:hypothetical protein
MENINLATLLMLASTPFTASSLNIEYDQLPFNNVFPEAVIHNGTSISTLPRDTKMGNDLNILFDFADKLREESTELDGEIVRMIDKNMWDLI